MGADYVPKSDEKFLDWAKNLYSVASSGYTNWQIPNPQGVFKSLLDNYASAFHITQSPNRGKIDVLQKNESRDALKSVIRSYAKAYLMFNPLITDSEKESMGLHLHLSKSSTIPPPSTYPEAEIDSSILRQLTIHFRDNGSRRRGKPKGVHGVEIRWELLPAPPVSIEDIKNSVFNSRSPQTFVFEENKRGQTVYFCLRWENSKGEKGPWGEIYSAIIP
jgi:hypothetical protein